LKGTGGRQYVVYAANKYHRSVGKGGGARSVVNRRAGGGDGTCPELAALTMINESLTTSIIKELEETLD
jgi:hypothetical protein